MSSLVDVGASLDCVSSDGVTALQLAAKADELQILMKARGRAAVLLAAASHGSLGLVKALVESGEDIHETDHQGRNPLMLAVQRGHHEIVDLLLHNGADVQSTDAKERTPLILAAASKHPSACEIIESLLLCDANVEAKDSHGRSALHLATRSGQLSAVEALLDCKADATQPRLLAASVLKPASSNRTEHREIMRKLLAAGARPDKAAAEELLQLLKAVIKDDDLDLIVRISEAGVPIRDRTHPTLIAALRTACKGGNPVLARALLRLGVDITQKDASGYTVLMSASWLGHLEVVECLLAERAEIDEVNDYNTTALGLALKNNNEAVVRRLIRAGASKDLALQSISKSDRKKAERLMSNN